MYLRSFLLFVVLLFVPALSYPAGVEDIAAALDGAQSPAEISRQVAVLEKMTGRQVTCPPMDALILLGRAYYMLADSESDKKKSMPLLEKAVSAEDRALRADPGNPHALYWRSLALLLQSDIVGGLKALKLVKEALRDLDAVSAKDGLYDSAGPYRIRGKVLIEAPSWALIGDKKKGLELLLKAKAMVPACLVNHLYLAQAYVANGRKDDAKAEIGWIMATPVNPKKQKDDLDTKAEARKLLDSL